MSRMVSPEDPEKLSEIDDVVSEKSDHKPVLEHPGLNQQEAEDQFLVKWTENDPENPYKFSLLKKSVMTFQLGMLACVGSLGSSITSAADAEIVKEFGTSQETAIFTVSFYVIGFCVGPCIWAPLSELYGRKLSMIPPMIGLVVFSIGSGASKSLAALFVTRFFGGIFGSSPVANVTASLGDFWEPKVRGTAIALYAVCVIGGQMLGPTIGAAVTVTPGMGWRWTEYIFAIWTGVISVIAFFCFPEVYAPFILSRKAQRLRKETGENRWYHPHEHQKLNLRSIVTKHLARPILMMVTEPAVTCITLYASYIFGILYMTLQFYPLVYRDQRGWSLVISTTPFLAMFVGVLFALFVNIGNQPYYRRAVARAGGKPVPEARCPPMIVGGLLFAIGLFLFGWTANPSIPWPASIIGCAFIGAGINITFQQCVNFLIDTYSVYAASAVSANTILRSVMAATLPFSVRRMYQSLGVGPSMSVLGAIAVAALPIPFFFIKYGAKLRSKSRFSNP